MKPARSSGGKAGIESLTFQFILIFRPNTVYTGRRWEMHVCLHPCSILQLLFENDDVISKLQLGVRICCVCLRYKRSDFAGKHSHISRAIMQPSAAFSNNLFS